MTSAQSNPVTIVGAGGIGCAIGHALTTGGVDVTMVDANPTKVQAGTEHGITIDGQGAQTAAFITFDAWQPGDDDLVILCTKCFDNSVVLAKLGSQTTIIPVQNGFDPQLQERCTYEGIASFVSECDQDRPHTRITRDGDLHIGSSGGNTPLTDELSNLADVLEANGCFTVQRVDDILPFKHTKLMYNAAISPLAAITGMDNGQLLTHAPARKLFFRFLRENYAILKQSGTTLGTVGPFHPDTVNKILRTPLLGTLMAGPFSRSLRGTYCSMSGDIESGRTEVDNFNGHLVRLANGSPCPINQAACKLVTRMADEHVTPAMSYLDELIA